MSAERKREQTTSEGHAGPALHRIVSIAQRVLRVLLVLSTITAGVFFVIPVPLVVVPAIAMVICFALVLLVNAWERKLRAGVPGRAEPVLTDPQRAGPGPESQEEIAPDPPESMRPVRRTEAKVIIGIVLGIAMLSIFVAAALYDWKLAGFAAFFAFVWLLFSGAPFWLAAAVDKSEETREEVQGRDVRSIR